VTASNPDASSSSQMHFLSGMGADTSNKDKDNEAQRLVRRDALRSDLFVKLLELYFKGPHATPADR